MTEPIRDASRLYEVERRVRHAERPGFRINELQISPTQSVPWHCHSAITDTIYVIEGAVVLSLRSPVEEISLGPGQSYAVAPRRPHRVANAGMDSATFLAIQGVGDYDFVPVDDPGDGLPPR